MLLNCVLRQISGAVGSNQKVVQDSLLSLLHMNWWYEYLMISVRSVHSLFYHVHDLRSEKC